MSNTCGKAHTGRRPGRCHQSELTGIPASMPPLMWLISGLLYRDITRQACYAVRHIEPVRAFTDPHAGTAQ